MRVRQILLILSLLQAAVVAFVIFKATDEEWRAHQLRYLDTTMGRASSGATRAALEGSGLEIQQDILKSLGEETRVDRCRSCHMAIDDASFKEGSEPLRTHPPIAEHPFNEFGCTICHEGDGRALDKEHAHGATEFWPEPLLSAPYIESSCARCPPEPYLDETPHLRRGCQLFASYGCAGCHTVRGVSRGKIGPELTDVGSRFKLDYLNESIENPKANAPLSTMPTFPMPAEDRRDLVVYLKSLRGRTLIENPITLRVKTREWNEQQPPTVEVSAEAGRRAFENRPCLACHQFGDKGGRLAPNLSFIGLIRSPEYIAKHLADPRAHSSGSSMPTFWMSDEERRAIALYLAKQTTVAVPATPREQYELLCVRCHGDQGRGDGVIADNLLPRPRELTNAKFFNWIPEERAARAISEGVSGTAMPPFGRLLSEAQARELFAWIRAQFIGAEGRPERKPRAIPARNPVPYSSESVKRGAAAFQVRCYGCHGRRGDGKGPNAFDLVPRPRDLRSTAFVARLDDARLFESITYGIVGTAMPPWDFLADEQRWDLVNFIRSISETGPAAANPGQEEES